MNILFVDDETMILNSLKRGLRKLPYDFYYVSSGQAALELMKTTPMDVVFSDMKMPKMSGLELLKTIEKEYPDTVKVILSGYAQLPQLIATINQSSIFKYVAKPWDLYNELIPVLEECVTYSKYRIEQRVKSEKLENINTAYQKIFMSYSSKVATKEQSWDIIRIFQQVYTKALKEMIVNPQVPMKEKENLIDSFKTFMDLFIDEVKNKEIYFEPVRVLNEVKVELKRMGHQLTLEFDQEDIPKTLYMGRGLHLRPILILLMDNLVITNSLGTVNIKVEEAAQDENRFLVNYVLSASKRLFSEYKKISHNLLLYKSMLKVFGGDLAIQVTNSNVIINIKIVLMVNEGEAKSEEDISR